jgi:uncharacterized caspase-like protein
MRGLILFCALAVALAGAPSWAQDGAKRVALVVGNADYENAPKLRNPTNDADSMARALRAIGFDVIEVKNATKQRMERSIGEFGARLAKGEVGLFYYSGHGMQVAGRNYLIPVDAAVTSEGTVPIETTDVNLVLDQMSLAGSRVNIVILDACRGNPFARGFRGFRGFRGDGEGGLAPMTEAPSGTLIAFATSPGKVADDGDGANGVYTGELIKALAVPGIAVEEMFKRVRVAVAADTKAAQTPWEESSLTGDFYFVPATTAETVAPPPPASSPSPPPAATIPGDSAEIVYWNSIKDDKSAEGFEAYLAQYPAGQFANLARLRIAQLESPAPPSSRDQGPQLQQDQQQQAEQRRQQEYDAIRRQQAEAERQRQIEIEKIREQQAEADSRRQAEIDQIRQQQAEIDRRRQQQVAQAPPVPGAHQASALPHLAVPLPGNITLTFITPGSDVPAADARFYGVWEGHWEGAAASDLIVDYVDGVGNISGVYLANDSPRFHVPRAGQRFAGKIIDEGGTAALHFQSGPTFYAFKIQADGSMFGTSRNTTGTAQVTMSKLATP